jgi:NTP pyrophosphatase (non-canonical NTP hydrolase)
VSDSIDNVDIGKAFAAGYLRGHTHNNPPTPPNGFATPQQRNLLQQLAEQCLSDSNKYFPQYASQGGTTGRLVHFALALCTEAGEFGEIVKKIDRGSFDYSNEGIRAALKNEAVDVLIYLMNIFGELGVDPLKAYFEKRDFNNSRFTKGDPKK